MRPRCSGSTGRSHRAGLGLDTGQVHLLPHPSWKVLAPLRHIFDLSRGSSIFLALPPATQDRSYVQGSELVLSPTLRVSRSAAAAISDTDRPT